MRLYNTLSRKKEEFVPAGDTVLIYGCGPTVYNKFHIGNARAFVVFDTLRRYLTYRGFKVRYVQNFTDVDDKIINKAAEEGTAPELIAARYIEEYFKDADGLNIQRADDHPLATEYIGGMIDLASKLIEKGHAYETKGDVYFRTRSFPDYGKLSHQPLDELESGARVGVDERKEDPLDFALWKAAKPDEPSWESPWGEGRPGWHIECSVMASSLLGDTIDIHCGGQDLVFPHHENEIAQSEAATGQKFARFWLHNAYINVDNKKMSKSEGNFFMTRNAAEIYGYDTIRFFILSAHYRSPINFSADIMESAKAALSRIKASYQNLMFLLGADIKENDGDESAAEDVVMFHKAFREAMDDDLNTADAIAVIFDAVRKANIVAVGNPTKEKLRQYAELISKLCEVLGFDLEADTKEEDEILELVEQRTQARKAKDYKKADEIRQKLKEMGVTLEDTPQGVKIIKE